MRRRRTRNPRARALINFPGFRRGPSSCEPAGGSRASLEMLLLLLLLVLLMAPRCV